MRPLVLPLTLLPILALAQPAQPQQQPMDDDFAKSVKQWTTKPEFLSPLVDHLPKGGAIPSPKDILGYHVGNPKKLTHYSRVVGYFEALQKASPRVKIMNVGKTEEGRDCITVAIADETTIRDLNTYKGYLAQLADPRKLSEADAKQVVSKAKPIYHLTGGLHASETGSPEMLMELAYRLVAEQGPLYDNIRKNLIVFITPALEPDGQERYTDWYYRHKIAEEGEEDRMPGPPYWGKYIFHDNNRDINYSQQTMRNWLRAYLDWHPPIIHDLHESVPFLYTFSGQTPHNPNLDPILYTELPFFAHYELSKMVSYGMPGVWTHAFVDMWSVGYLGFMASNHNGMLRMYETFGNAGANTMKRKVDAGGGGGFGASQRQWYRPLPAYSEVEWSLRNNTNFMQTGVLSALELASNNPGMILENFYRKSKNSVEAGTKEAPYGWVIPAGQKDQVRVAFLVNTLRTQGIEVGRRDDGTFVIRRDQPYGRLAKSLLEKQVYPDPNQRTYDDTGWTMGLMAGVTVNDVKERKDLDTPAPILTADYQPKGSVEGASAKYIAVPDYGSNALITLRYHLKDVAIEATEKTVGDLPAGSFLIPASAKAKSEVESLGLAARYIADKPASATHPVDLPKLAVFSMWGSTQEVGWVRHALDHFDVQYDLIFKERIKQGNLRRSYDVILMPQQGAGAKSMIHDLDCKGRNLSYTQSQDQKSLGMYGQTEDICGGMGLAGALEIEKFVQEGGRLITLGRSSLFATELGLARRVEGGRPSPTFYAPGPIVETAIAKADHPVFYGYEGKTIHVRYSNGPLFTVPDEDKKKVVLSSFVGTDKSVLSGSINRVGEIKDKPVVLDVASGQGRILMFATNPCYRWQNHQEFPMLFNAILHWNDFNN